MNYFPVSDHNKPLPPPRGPVPDPKTYISVPLSPVALAFLDALAAQHDLPRAEIAGYAIQTGLVDMHRLQKRISNAILLAEQAH